MLCLFGIATERLGLAKKGYGLAKIRVEMEKSGKTVDISEEQRKGDASNGIEMDRSSMARQWNSMVLRWIGLAQIRDVFYINFTPT